MNDPNSQPGITLLDRVLLEFQDFLDFCDLDPGNTVPY
jgi:hypothetical protein